MNHLRLHPSHCLLQLHVQIQLNRKLGVQLFIYLHVTFIQLKHLEKV